MQSLVYDWLRFLAVHGFLLLITLAFPLLIHLVSRFRVRMSSGDEGDGLSRDATGASRHTCLRQSGPWKLPKPEDLFLNTDYTRPPPVKEDLVVFKSKKGVSMGHVYRLNNKSKTMPEMYKDLSGMTCKVEVVPNNKKAWRSIEEIFVIDRQFSVGEIVQTFENAYAGQPKARELWMNTEKMLGVITDIKTTVDVLAVPGKKLVLKDILIEKEPEWAELIGFNLSHNFVLYKHWIGDARDCVYEVTLVNRKGERVVVRESGEHEDGVRLLRSATDETKALIPGEVVQISVHDISSKFARWLVPQNRVPATIKRRRRRRNDDFVHMVVEKIEALEMDIEWLTSPADMMDMPPNRLQRSELDKIVRLETTVNPRLSPSDRFILPTKDEHTFITKTEYLKEVSTKYDGLFKQYKESQPNQMANVDPDAAPGPSPKMQRIEEQEEPEEPMETDEIIDVEAISETDDSSEEEEDEEPVTRTKKRTRRTRQTRKAPPKTRLSSERRAKALFGEKFFAEVMATRSLVTVKWMNGKEETDIPSYTLVPVDPDIDQQDHLPGTLVCKKEEENPDLKFGIILSANATERSCQVRWFKRATITSPLEFEKDEEVTLFDIMLHRSYKRTYPGYYGVDTEKNTSELKESAYQVIRDLENGKQLVRFFDDSLAEKWPDEITQLQFEEMADNTQDDNSLSTDDEFDQDTTALMNLASIPATQEKRLGVKDAPPAFCQKVYELLRSDMPDSFFEAMALMIIAVPVGGDKTRIFDYKPPGMDLLPDRKGFYYYIEGKYIWNHTHQLVKDTALLLKCMRISYLPYALSISPYDLSKHLRNASTADREVIQATLCEYPNIYRSTRYFERENDDFMTTVCRMAKFAGVHIFDKSPPENESCLLFVTPMFDEFDGQFNEELNEYLNKEKLVRVTDKELRYEDSLGKYGFWVKAQSPEQARTFVEDGGIDLRPFKDEDKKVCILSLEEFALLSNFMAFLDASYVNGNWLLRGAQRLKYHTVESPLSLSIVHLDAAPSIVNDLKDGEKISSFCVIRDTAVTTMAASSCDLVGQIISSSNPLATVHTAERYPSAEKHFLTYTALLQREGIISGPYIDFDEVIKKYMQIVVRREFEGIHYYDLKLLQTALSSVLSPRHFQHRERFNQLIRGGFTYLNIKDNISQMTNRLVHSSKLLELKDKAAGELKAELEKWCQELDLQTKEETSPETSEGKSKFEMLNEVSEVHNYIKKSSANGREFFKAVRKEHKMLSEHLPDGIFAKAYSDRMDLLTAVIIGPKETPFESVPFVFHLYLPETYPQVPPEVHYVAYSQEQLNPNLYQCGKVCTSLLGTWNGVGNENWNPSSSNLLQVLTSIQGLILVPEPYFNEAGYESRRGQPDMVIHSQRYNETVIINALDYMRRINLQPPTEWKEIVHSQVQNAWPGLVKLYTSWLEDKAQPPFPVTGSKGFWMALKKAVEKMRDTVQDTENAGEMKCEVTESKGKKEKKETDEDPLHNMYIFISPDFYLPA